MRITNDLARLTIPSQRNIDYGEMAHKMKATDIKRELLTDEMSFTGLTQDMALSLHDHINKGEKRSELRKFFMPPGVFDGVVNVLVQELTKNPVRPHLCDSAARKALIDQLVTKITHAFQKSEPRRFADVC